MNDVSGRSGRAAGSATKKLPPLSPAFLTQEDAAYWVHLRVPLQADREYGSVILQRPDGKFVATSPIAGDVSSFDLTTIIELDASSLLVPPKGYSFAANIHSHPPRHGVFRKLYPDLDEMNLRLFINFFSSEDFIGDVANQEVFPSVYLSGPDGTLLKYSPSGSEEEFNYYSWHDAGSPPGHPHGTYDVPSIIRKFATVGELKVVVSNADWGNSVGVVPRNWQRGKAFAQGVVREMPLMTRVCSTAERAVLAALKLKGAQTSGLLLRDLTGKAFVATLARPAGLAAWDPARLFPPGEGGQLKLPDGYALEGFYDASGPPRAQLPATQPWLYESFFTPQAIAWAVACHGKSRQLSAPGEPLSLYLQTKDAAMLKYTFSGSPIEAALSVAQADGTIGDGGVQAKLASGALRPREFVAMLVLAGTVEVLRGSPLWARLGRVDLDWTPYADFHWPVLSRSFLSADDAARYAHEQIGERRERQRVGYVFQTPEGFVATEPLAGDIASLRLGTLYPLDSNGRPIFPDDCVLHARYVAHEALSRLDPLHVQSLHWSRQQAALSLQMLSVEETRQVLLDNIALYVSGAPNSLISYQPSATALARDLSSRLGTPEQPGALAAGLDNGTVLPEALIREQAAAARMTTLLDNTLWGGRGQIAATWSAPLLTAVSTLRRPEPVSFGAMFSSADDAALDRYAHDTRLQDQARPWFGFILKHDSREAYIASELVPVSDQRNNVFQLQAVFGVQRTPPWYQYPQGFHLHACFYSRQRVKLPANAADAWLAQHFIAPDDLAISVYYARRRSLAPLATAALYISTHDGALLKYVKHSTSTLFDDDSPLLRLDTLKRNLVQGLMQAEDFVRVVGSSGELTVMRTSRCWDRAGLVTTDWQPSAYPQRRELTPVFQSADDAAVYAKGLIPGMTQRPYGGVILKRTDGLYVATTPIEISREDFDIGEIYPEENPALGSFPAGCRVIARYRSRVARELSVLLSSVEKQIYANMLSVHTLYSVFVHLRDRHLSEYLFAPDGAVIRYEPGLWDQLFIDFLFTLAEYQAVPESFDAKKIKQCIHSGELLPSAWVDALAKTGHLNVVVGSLLWGLPGTVSEWPTSSISLPPPSGYSKATSAPACSPAFVQADAAARYVHEALLSRDTQTFGFISCSPQGLYIASLPVEVQKSALALDRVFEQGKLTEGFALYGIYLRSALPALGAPNDDLQYFCFPLSDVQRACAQANTPQGYRPIYFSCADGALLRLQLHAFEPGEFHDRFGQIELRPNAFVSMEQAAIDERDIADGTFKFADYVRRMAHAGQLDVIETSAYWSRHGQVAQDWQPRQVDVRAEQRWRDHPVPALGPIFHHPDDAARYAHQRTDDAVVDTGYEGAVLAQQSSSRFVPLEPMVYVVGEENPLVRIVRTGADSAVSWRNPAPRYPAGYALMATHQFHVSGNTLLVPDADQVYANFASPALVLAHTHEPVEKGLGIRDYYYSTPHGVLLKYTPVYSQAEKNLLSTRAVTFEGGRWVSRLSPGEFLARLMELGDFRVLVAGHYWHQTGRMGNTWRTRRQQSPTPGPVRLRDEL
ncbi:DUF4329 domain-containing protein [Pseudomonas hamedanensis]|uniref:DUF4329 domain-containing protein n=1 Tax=Pseudomonas hamedanensis TaxID=2745504 RepID=UPI001CECF4A9|nr:DUF4329 domain-containing protein [Pseudomonas hamedanensis]